MQLKKVKTIDGNVVFATTVVVEKTFNYSCSFSRLKKAFLKKVKNKKISCFSIPDNYEKVVFHHSGIEKQNFVHYFNYEKLSKDYNFLELEEESFDKSSLILIPLNVIEFEKTIASTINESYRKVYSSVKELFCEHNDELLNSFNEFDSIKEIFNKTFGNDEPIETINFRKELKNKKQNAQALSAFVDKLDKCGNGVFKLIGHTIKKLQSLSMLVLSLKHAINSIETVFNKVYLLIGNYNVVTFCYEINEEYEIANCHFASDENYTAKGIKELKHIKNNVSHSFDSFSDMFEYVDFNSFFGFNNKNYFSKLDKSGETKRIVFVSNKYKEYPTFSNVDSLTLCTYVKNISMFYNLLCVSICYYRSISFESLKERTEHNILFKNDQSQLKERMNWVNDKSSNGNIINKAPIDDAENLFIDYSTIVYGYIVTVNRLLSISLNDENEIISIFNNHHIRFRSADIFYSIVSSIIYCSMLLKVCSSLRIVLNNVNSAWFPIIKNALIKNYIIIYNRSLVLYNSSSIFINAEKMEFHNILLKSLSVVSKISDIKNSSEVAWQEANILNGYVFPLLQLLLAIASFVVVFNVSGNGIMFWNRFGICLAFSMLFCIMGFVPRGIAHFRINTKKLPVVSKNSLHKNK